MGHSIYSGEFSFCRILCEAWRVYRREFWMIFLIFLLVFIPVNLILNLIPVDSTLEGFKWYWRIMRLLERFVGVIAYMALMYLVQSSIDRRHITLGAAFRKAFIKWPTVIWTGALAGLFILGLTLLLIVPGVIFYGYWIFVIYVVVLRDRSGMAALRHSRAVVQGRWWKVFWYTFLISLMAFMLGIAVGLPYYFMPDSFIISVILDTGIDVMSAYFVVASTVMFINFDSNRKRKKK